MIWVRSGATAAARADPTGPIADRPQEGARVAGEAFGQMDDHRPQVQTQRASAGDDLGGGGHEVLFVVPIRLQSPTGRPGDAHHL